MIITTTLKKFMKIEKKKNDDLDLISDLNKLQDRMKFKFDRVYNFENQNKVEDKEKKVYSEIQKTL